MKDSGERSEVEKSGAAVGGTRSVDPLAGAAGEADVGPPVDASRKKFDGAADCGGADARVLTMPRYNLHVATEASFS